MKTKPDLKELERRLDGALAKETPESLNKFLGKSAKETTSEQKLYILDLLRLMELETITLCEIKYYSEKSVLLLLKKALLSWEKSLYVDWNGLADNINTYVKNKKLTAEFLSVLLGGYSEPRETSINVSHSKEPVTAEIRDIIDCIVKWDTMHNTHKANADYLSVIQRDLKKLTIK